MRESGELLKYVSLQSLEQWRNKHVVQIRPQQSIYMTAVAFRFLHNHYASIAYHKSKAHRVVLSPDSDFESRLASSPPFVICLLLRYLPYKVDALK